MDYGAGACDSGSRFLTIPLPESFRGQCPPPPSPRGGDPNAQAKIKCPEGLEVYWRSAEKSIEFYNMNNPYGAGACDSGSRFLTNPLPESFRDPWQLPLPPSSHGGDLNAQAKIKFPQGLEVYRSSAEKAIGFNNMNNPYGAGACDSVSRFLTNPLPESVRAPWQLPLPPSSHGGDLNAQAKIKCPQGLEVYRRSAEKSIEFYNMNNRGADFEAVEILAVSFFFSCGTNYHMNFKAKPKTAADDDHHSVRIFFAELSNFESVTRHDFSYLGEGETFTCSLLEEGSSAYGCSGCCPSQGILHPPQGYYTGNVNGNEPVLKQKWLALRDREYKKSGPKLGPGVTMASYFYDLLSSHFHGGVTG